MALLAVAACAAENRDLEVKGPCIAALACWGDQGLQCVVEIALKDSTSKNISAAVKLLASIAADRPLVAHSAFILDAGLLTEINTYLANASLADQARRRLAELIMAIPADELLIPLGTAFMQVAISDPEIAGEIIAVLSSKWLGFGPNELDAFETLLDAQPDDEPALHAFLERYPQILDPMAAQVWSKPDFHGFKEPDFLIRRNDDSYVVVEIENAAKPLMTQASQPSQYVTQAVKQANDYRAFLLERIMEARQHFPNIHDPDALVVIGREVSLTQSQTAALKQENHSRNKLRIVGFDWLLQRSRTVLSNVAASKVEVIKGYRVV